MWCKDVHKWECRVYDVLGNADEGYTVNDSFVIDTVAVENETLAIHEEREALIRDIFDIRDDVKLYITSEENAIYIDEYKTGYPIGEMNRILGE